MDTEESINLADIFRFLNEGKYWIFFAGVGCMILGAIYVFLLATQKYEASVHVEMAQVTGKPVEMPNALVEKLKLPLYYSTNTLDACQVQGASPSAGAALAGQLKLLASKNSPVTTIKFRGTSTAHAEQCLEAIFADIKKNQDALFRPVLTLKHAQLRLLEQKLNAAEQLMSELPVKEMRLQSDDPKFSASTLLLATSISKDNEIKDLRIQINDLQLSLAESQTRETSLITPVYVGNTPVEPRQAFVLLLSLAGGFILGMLIFAGRKNLRQKISI